MKLAIILLALVMTACATAARELNRTSDRLADQIHSKW